MSKKNKLQARKKIALELIHQRLGHRSTRLWLAGYTSNVWEDVELRIDPDPSFISCQISSMNKKARYRIPLKPKSPFKWVFMDIIPSTTPKSLTSDTTFVYLPYLQITLCTHARLLKAARMYTQKTAHIHRESPEDVHARAQQRTHLYTYFLTCLNNDSETQSNKIAEVICSSR